MHHTIADIDDKKTQSIGKHPYILYAIRMKRPILSSANEEDLAVYSGLQCQKTKKISDLI